MEQQRHLEPDVVPTPHAAVSKSAGKRRDGKAGCAEDKIPEETSTVKDLAPMEEIDLRMTTRAPPRMAPPAEEVTDEPVCTPSYNFGQYPMTMTCPCCDYAILTYVQYDISVKQYMICVFLCVCFLWPCSLIPCLFRGMYDVYHFCPVCRRLIGVFKA